MPKKITINGHVTNIPDEVDLTELLNCCSEVRAELTDHKLKLQKIEAEYYTKDEIDDIVKELLGGDPIILNLTDAIIDVGDSFDPMAGVEARDGQGADITANVIVTGTVDTSTAGTYVLTYSVTDSHGYTTTLTRNVVVESAVMHTTLFNDGTLIINEKESNRTANEILHGAVVAQYNPGPYNFSGASSQPWNGKRAEIKSVKIGSRLKPTTMAYYFASLENCESIDFTNLDTSDAESMYGLFYLCKSLTSLDLSSFNTEHVVTMMQMFRDCESLTSLDLSNFDTQIVTNMSRMFWGCKSLTSLDVSMFDTKNVMYMTNMFNQCESLTSLDLSNFETRNGLDGVYMFRYCYNIRTIYVSDKWQWNNGERGSSMFEDCNNLVGGAGTVYNSGVTDSRYARIDNPPTAPGYFTAKP